MEEFVKLIALNYKSISYHNFSHAFSLMQVIYFYILAELLMYLNDSIF
jgi:hypothetical protein